MRKKSGRRAAANLRDVRRQHRRHQIGHLFTVPFYRSVLAQGLDDALDPTLFDEIEAKIDSLDIDEIKRGWNR